jgi:hypothetical protein
MTVHAVTRFASEIPLLPSFGQMRTTITSARQKQLGVWFVF